MIDPGTERRRERRVTDGSRCGTQWSPDEPTDCTGCSARRQASEGPGSRASHRRDERAGRAADLNLTQARQKNDLGRDPVTHEPDDPYAPHQRAARALSAKELAEAAALLAAYGSDDIDPVHKRWITALDRIEDEYVNSEFRYWEQQERAVPDDFAAVLQDERHLRAELGSRVRQVLEDGRVRRFRRL